MAQAAGPSGDGGEMQQEFKRLQAELEAFMRQALRQEFADFQAKARYDLQSVLRGHSQGHSQAQNEALRFSGSAESRPSDVLADVQPNPSLQSGMSNAQVQKWVHRGAKDPVVLQELRKLNEEYERRDAGAYAIKKGISVVAKRSTTKQRENSGGELDGADSRTPHRFLRGTQTSAQLRMSRALGINFEEGSSFREWVSDVVQGTNFDYCSGLLVLLNAVVLGVQTDWQARKLTRTTPMAFRVIEVIFCFIFLIEIGLRVYVYRRAFFSRRHVKWHLLDCVLVATQIAEQIIMSLQPKPEGESANYTNMSILRLLRILRLIRVTRLVRVLRLIGELRTLIISIFGAMRHLSWAIILLLLLMYVVGVYLTQLVLEHRIDNPEITQVTRNLEFFYGTLGDTILSIYKGVTGGIDWGEILEPLRSQISTAVTPFFMLYIAFVVLCMLNVVTGVFVESALATAKRDKATYMVSSVKSVFDQFDENKNGCLNMDEFQSALQSVDMKQILSALDIDASEADGLFLLLDVDLHGEISAEDFANGCARLRGPAKALEMAIFMREFSSLSSAFISHRRSVDAYLRVITQHLTGHADIRSRLNTGDPHGPPQLGDDSNGAASVAPATSLLPSELPGQVCDPQRWIT